MLLGDDLHMDEGWTLVLWKRVTATQSYSEKCRILQIFRSISTPKKAMEFTATTPVFKWEVA